MKSVTKKPRNKFETRIYKVLKRTKACFRYESERIPYVLSGHYIPDFVLTTSTGKVYIETKGYFRPEAKRKLVAVKKQHPELDIRLLFYSTNKSYIKWCDRYGFKWAVDKIPTDWLLGL